MNLNIFAPLNNLGYGIHSYNYIKSLLPYYGINYTGIGDVECNDKKFLSKLNIDFDINTVSLMIFHEFFMNRFAGKIRIGYPVFELDKIDNYSIKLLNQLDYIFVTSKWAKEI